MRQQSQLSSVVSYEDTTLRLSSTKTRMTFFSAEINKRYSNNKNEKQYSITRLSPLEAKKIRLIIIYLFSISLLMEKVLFLLHMFDSDDIAIPALNIFLHIIV